MAGSIVALVPLSGNFTAQTPAPTAESLLPVGGIGTLNTFAGNATNVNVVGVSMTMAARAVTTTSVTSVTAPHTAMTSAAHAITPNPEVTAAHTRMLMQGSSLFAVLVPIHGVSMTMAARGLGLSTAFTAPHADASMAAAAIIPEVGANPLQAAMTAVAHGLSISGGATARPARMFMFPGRVTIYATPLAYYPVLRPFSTTPGAVLGPMDATPAAVVLGLYPAAPRPISREVFLVGAPPMVAHAATVQNTRNVSTATPTPPAMAMRAGTVLAIGNVL